MAVDAEKHLAKTMPRLWELLRLHHHQLLSGRGIAAGYITLGCVLFTGCGDTQLDSLGKSRLQPELIDDLEDGDDQIPQAFGRSGGWYIFNDGTGTQDADPPIPEKISSAPEGQFAMVTRGFGFDDWGAGLGVNVAGADLSVGYDASDFVGIRFYARAEIEEQQSVRVNFPSTQTGTLTECDDLDCNNHFGVDIGVDVEWQQHEVLFSEITQGVQLVEAREFQTRSFRDVQFLIPRGRDFELWIDFLEFIR